MLPYQSSISTSGILDKYGSSAACGETTSRTCSVSDKISVSRSLISPSCSLANELLLSNAQHSWM